MSDKEENHPRTEAVVSAGRCLRNPRSESRCAGISETAYGIGIF
jgi:hypothetical protein